MLRIFAINWWLVGLRGLSAVLFGIVAILWPALTLGILIIIFGLYVIVDGIFTIVLGIGGRKYHSNSWWMIFEGLIRIAVGVIAVVWPGLTSISLVILIAIWAIITGIIGIILAIRLRKEIKNELLMGMSSALSVLLGIILIAQPNVGALAVVFLIGFYAILFGILLIIFAFQMQKRKKSLDQLIQGNLS